MFGTSQLVEGAWYPEVLRDYDLDPVPSGMSLLGVWTWVCVGQEEQEAREVA